MIQLKRAYEPAEAARGRVTLVYSAHDETHNNAVVLAREARASARTVAGDGPPEAAVLYSAFE